MSTLLCLGGYGTFGLETARILAGHDAVDRLIVAGRHLPEAEAAAASLGTKARALQLDVDDQDALPDAVRGATVVVSTLWQPATRQDRIITAAAAAGAHYCDLNGRRPGAEVDRLARDAGVAAIVGAGSAPGVTNLLGRAAAEVLEEVEGVLGVMVWPRLLDAWSDLFEHYVPLPGGPTRGPSGRRLYATLTSASLDPEATLAVIRDALVAPFWLRLLADPSGWVERVPMARSGAIHHGHPREDGVDVPLTAGGWRAVRPLLTEGHDLPQLPGVPVQSASLSGFSDALDEALLAAAVRVAEGAEAASAAEEVLRTMGSDLPRYLLPPEELAALPAYAAVAVGRSGGKVMRASARLDPVAFHPENFVRLTAAALALTVGGLLDGSVTARGVRSMDEAVRLDDAFTRAYEALLPVAPQGGRLITRDRTPA
jgi:hypothetical protein